MDNDYIIIDTEDIYKYIPDNIENIILLDFNKYWKTIIQSYRDDNDIWNQFKMDIVRSKFNINHCPITDPYIIKQFLDNCFHSYIVNDILMVCTQVLMGSPYELISTTILPYNWYLGELGLNSELDKQMTIDLTINPYELSIRGKKKLRIFRLNDDYIDETLYIVDINLEIDLLNKNKVLIKINNN